MIMLLYPFLLFSSHLFSLSHTLLTHCTYIQTNKPSWATYSFQNSSLWTYKYSITNTHMHTHTYHTIPYHIIQPHEHLVHWHVCTIRTYTHNTLHTVIKPHMRVTTHIHTYTHIGMAHTHTHTHTKHTWRWMKHTYIILHYYDVWHMMDEWMIHTCKILHYYESWCMMDVTSKHT